MQGTVGNRSVAGLFGRTAGPASRSSDIAKVARVQRQGKPTDAEPIDVGNIFVFSRPPTDVAYARKLGRDDAAHLRKAGTLTTEDNHDIDAKLKYFKGRAREAYLAEIEPARLEVAGPTTTRERARTSGQLDHLTYLTGILELKKARIAAWKSTADKAKPNAAEQTLLIIIPILAEGLGGISLALIEKLFEGKEGGKLLAEFVGLAGLEATDIAAETAFHKALENNKDALSKGTRKSLESKEKTVKAALATESGNIKDVYAELLRLQVIQEFVDTSTAFNTQSMSLTDQEITNRDANLKQIYDKIRDEPEPFLQEITTKFIRLLEESKLAEEAGDYGGDRNKMWQGDEELHSAAPWFEGGNLEIFPWPRNRSLGKPGSPDFELDFNIYGNGVNPETLERLLYMQVKDLHVTLAFRFRVNDGQSEIGFVRNTDGGSYLDDRFTDSDGSEWLTSYYSGESRKHSDEERAKFAPLGAQKLYEAIKQRRVAQTDKEY